MWTCPKCRRECDTPFCPTCGYQMPNQYSEVDLLEEQAQKMIKLYKSWRLFAWILFGILTLIATIYIGRLLSDAFDFWRYNPEDFFLGAVAVLLGYAIISAPLLLSILVSKHTIKLWQNTIGFLKNNR